MTKYTSNEQYELDKEKVLDSLNRGVPLQEKFWGYYGLVYQLLQQSKWIGNTDDDNSASVKPIPVKKDGNGLAIKDYEVKDWFAKLNEELDKVKNAAFIIDISICAEYELQERKKALAMELQDLITVCTSYLDYLGFDEVAREKLCQQVNDKNRKRGYFEE